MKDRESKTEFLLKLLDGTLTDVEITRVNQLLSEDLESREILRSISEQAVVIAEHSRIHSDEVPGSSWPVESGPGLNAPRVEKGIFGWVSMVVTVVILAFSVGLLYQAVRLSRVTRESGETEGKPEKELAEEKRVRYGQERFSEDAVATISGASGALIWTGDRGRIVSEITVGTQLAGGTIEGLAPDSWFELRFRDGSTVTLSGASLLTFADQGQKQLRLREGRLSANVEAQPIGKPMLVHTRSARLEVLGTRFDVESNLASTVLSVSKGKVKFRRLSDGSEVEVEAMHQVTTESEDALVPAMTSGAVHRWKSELNRDSGNYGKWQPPTDRMPATLKAVPLIPPAAPHVTLYLAGVSVDRSQGSPVVLKPGSRLVVRGRLRHAAQVHCGIRVNYPGGEFAGMFRGDLQKDQPLATMDSEGRFEETYRLPQFTLDPAVADRKSELASRPEGLILDGAWAFTHGQRSAGLEITEIEILPPDSQGLAFKDVAFNRKVAMGQTVPTGLRPSAMRSWVHGAVGWLEQVAR